MEWDADEESCVHPSDTCDVGNCDNPCTEDALERGHYYHSYCLDEAAYVHCYPGGGCGIKSCPRNTIWSDGKGRCVHEDRPEECDVGHCANPCTDEALEGGDLLHGHCTDLHLFVSCEYDGSCSVEACPSGRYWDEEYKECVRYSGSKSKGKGGSKSKGKGSGSKSKSETSYSEHRCDADTPCQDGSCCSQYGWCGNSGAHCGDGCLSNCWAEQHSGSSYYSSSKSKGKGSSSKGKGSRR